MQRIDDSWQEALMEKGRRIWACPNGHQSEIQFMLLDALPEFGWTMEWDFCEDCNARPSPEEVKKMVLSVFASWRRANLINCRGYGVLCDGVV